MSTTSQVLTYRLQDQDGTEEKLIVHQVMREIEDRRFSGRGSWRHQEVFFKIYVAVERAERHVQREKFGSKALIERNIPTAEVIYEADIYGGELPKGAKCLLFRWIDGAENLDRALHGVISETRALSLLRSLATTVGHLHGTGLIQKDLHFGNFAVVENTIYTFDPGSIEVKGKPVPRGAALENLALFFAQMDPVYVNTTTMSLFLDSYIDSRGEEKERPESDKLWKRIVKERKRRMDRFLDKMLRPCRLVTVHKLTSGKKALFDRGSDQGALLDLVDSIDKKDVIVDGTTVQFLDKECRVCVFPSHGVSLFGFNELEGSARSWRAAQRLILEQVPVVRPLACVESSGKQDSWIVDQRSSGSTLQSELAKDNVDVDSIGRSIAEILVRLGQLNLVHNRMSLRSFAICDSQAYLCDVEELVDGKERPLDATITTSEDMRDLLGVLHGHDFYSVVLGALNDRGYAFES
ncbi:MAG: tRNA A-37 threonylcarbamoyl transferase component Bud32 [Planctomycetota bacterium]|jgi:tRNA A-37 threonylcarbamoyl transferase component Bud32